ncbi:class I SAM-dependent methyltransferase [Fontivita pretiosa]|uniref:class I SAM-dependent methyltransferase n=1 Tax=Fontivita pretiosa TaxID=2989684 RepID=UPI003D185A12
MKTDVTAVTNSDSAASFRAKAARTCCRSCGQQGLEPVLDLGVTALVDTLVTKERLNGPENKYPLQVAFCPSCCLMQTCDTPPPEEVFHEDYTYYASFSTTWLEHSRRCALQQIQRYGLNERSLVIELASNDGYLLKNYVEKGIPVLGIDPCRGPVEAARKIGVPTLHAFFGLELARKLVAEGKRADIVHANNVMAHVADLNGFVAGIAMILKDDGVLVTESPYVRDLIDNCEFDTIYHEHLCYYGVTSLKNLYARHGLYINDIERLPTHGGSLRQYVSKRPGESETVKRLLAEEQQIGLTRYGPYYQTFAHRVEAIKQEMLRILRELKAAGKRVAAYGASAKGSTMLSYLGAGPELIEFVVDRNVHKQGKFMPGVHNPIYDVGAIQRLKPDYLVLLVWNLKDEILKQQQAYRDAGGKFIIPIPYPEIV